jgi:hypothetical protein
MASNYVKQPRTIEDGSAHRPGYNGTGTDIAAGYILKHDGTNVDGIALASASTDSLAGVSTEAIEDGKTRSYQRSGKAAVLAGGTVPLGAKVVADATGRAVTASAASAANFENTLGTCVVEGEVGDWLEIELEIGNKAYVASSTVATIAALKAIAAANRYEGQTVLVQANGSLWRFSATSTLTTDEAEALAVEPTAGTGCWLRVDKTFVAKLPIAYTTADGAAILTVPAGFCLRMIGFPWWEVTTGFTGGTDSAIGVSTNLTGYETKGDILGGATGELTATLGTDGIKLGTIGGELDDIAGMHAMLFPAASEFQFDRIASVYEAGAGFVCVPVAQVTV